MSIIHIFTMDIDGDGIEQPRAVGSFDTHLSTFWDGDGFRQVPVPGGYPGETVDQDLSDERLWRTADGRYVLTVRAAIRTTTRYLTDAEAEVWFAEVGLSDPERREIYMGSGHISPTVTR